jgi:hypothetical protein
MPSFDEPRDFKVRWTTGGKFEGKHLGVGYEVVPPKDGGAFPSPFGRSTNPI